MKHLPQIIGHRGACAYAPENTLSSIHTAADLGIDWVELNVKLTADNVPILFHDDSLNRTTNGSGDVAQASYADLTDLDAGSWFADSFMGETIPTLEQAIEACIERDLGINLEIKPCPGREVETAETALDMLSRYWDDHERLIISSFSHVSLETAQHIAADWTRAFLIDETPENLLEIAKHLQVQCMNINGNRDDLTIEQVESYIDAGFGVLAYSVNEPEKARHLISMGVDGIISDVPDQIKEQVFQRH